MATIPFAQVQRRLDRLPDRLRADPDQEVVITEDGLPTMVVLSWDRYESLLETDEIQRDEVLMRALRKSVQEIEQGEGLFWEEAKRHLGWR